MTPQERKVMELALDRAAPTNKGYVIVPDDAFQVIKEALAQPEQEPVAIVHRNEYNEYRLEPHDNFDIKSIPFNIDVPLFKSPQRTWVGLTDEQKQWIKDTEWTTNELVDWIEAKLKEKNA